MTTPNFGKTANNSITKLPALRKKCADGSKYFDIQTRITHDRRAHDSQKRRPLGGGYESLRCAGIKHVR